MVWKNKRGYNEKIEEIRGIVDNDKRVKHIENIDKSMKWLRENGLWEDFKDIGSKGDIK